MGRVWEELGLVDLDIHAHESIFSLLACEISKKYDVFDYELLIIFPPKSLSSKTSQASQKAPFSKWLAKKVDFMSF